MKRRTSNRHPVGLVVLSLTESCERFSFYGMQALLMIYMTAGLLPNEAYLRVWGFEPFRNVIEGVVGRLSDQAFASQVFGLYTGLVYLTPLIGGLIGDRLLGGRRTVLIGASLMALGHFLLAFDASFLIALAALICGSGCLKGNIATQVGRLYASNDARRDRAYLLFNFGINIGAFAGPLVCGSIGETHSWHLGFAIAGVGMLIGMVVYTSGWRCLPADRPRASDVTRGPRQADDSRQIAALLGLIGLSLCYNVPFSQGYNVFPLWIQQAANRHIGGFEVPVAWYLSSDGLVTVLSTPLVMMLWKRQAALGHEPRVASKIAIGCTMMAAADGLLALFAYAWPTPRTLGAVWGFGYFLLSSSAYLFVMPVLLAAVSRAAPARLTATMMGIAYAGLFVANITAGWLARFFVPLGPARFWVVQAAIAATGVLLATALRGPLSAPLYPTSEVA